MARLWIALLECALTSKSSSRNCLKVSEKYNIIVHYIGFNVDQD